MLAIPRQLRYGQLPKVHARLERNLDNSHDNSLGFIDDVRWRKKPHSVCKPDQVLLISIECDSLAPVSIQKQFRSRHNEIRIDLLPFGGLTHDTLQTVLVALGVDGGGQGRAAAYECSNKR